MKRLLNKLIGKRALKTKMTIAIALITVLVCFVNIAVSSWIFNQYENKYYNKVLDTTKVFAVSVEDTLEDIEESISYIVANGVYSDLAGSNHSSISVSEYVLQVLKNLAQKNEAVDAMWVIGDDSNIHIVSNPKNIDVRAVLDEFNKSDTDKWFSLPMYDNWLFKVMEASQYLGGDVICAVKVDSICSEYDNLVNVKDNSDFIVYYKGIRVYGNSHVASEYAEVTRYIQDEKIVKAKTDDTHMIYARYYSTKSGLYYVCACDHDVLFKSINISRNVSSYIYVLVLLVLLVIGYLFSSSILKPINSLSRKMTSISVTGEIEDVNEYMSSEYTDDEIGLLNRYFDNTIVKIKELTDENLEKQKLLQETRYHALELQIRPHFLYNTLETVKCLGITGNKKELCSVIDDLGNLLRKSLKSADFVSLEEELALLHHYVNIQKVRYDERFEYTEDIKPNMLSRVVPKMILQPIVENSINYCVDSTDEKCIVSVKSEEMSDHIRIVIEDNGPGMDEEFLARLRSKQIKPKGLGIGLANIDARLKLAYGEEYGLDISSVRGDGTKVAIRIPKGKIG